MALIRCSECGKEISDKAAACIHCGCPISAARQKTPEPGADTRANAQPAAIYTDFHAVLSGDSTGRTRQSVFVKELGQNVLFYVPNSIQVGQAIRVEMSGEPPRNLVFKVASISRTAAFNQAEAAPVKRKSGRSYEEIKAIIKDYEPNWFIRFLNSRRYYSIIFIFLGLIVKLALDGGFEDALIGLEVSAVFCLPLIIAKQLYPAHHLKKYLKKNRIDREIQKDTGFMNVSICAYNAMPGKKILAYIRKLNPSAAQHIEEQLAQSKKK